MQEQIILSLNTWMASSTFFSNIIPILSDIFVFSYPIYLVYLYFVAHDHQQRRKKIFLKTQQLQHKYDALLIFFSFVGSVVVNYILKAFVQQERPYKLIDLALNPKESLILNTIPTDSFPSDHAAVSMSIAIAVLCLWYQDNDTKKIIIWRTFFVFSMIMNVSRITIGVHRPVDIIAGCGIGWLVAFVLTRSEIKNRMSTHISKPLINLQENIFHYIQDLTQKTSS